MTAAPGAVLTAERSVAPPSGERAALRARLHGVDGLRFATAVAILAHHYVSRWTTVWGAPPEEVFGGASTVFAYAAIGPELFFVVSGFVILMTAWDRGAPEVLASRVGRLYPAYWAAVLLTSTLLLWLWPEGKQISLAEAAVNLTMLQSLWDVRHVDGVYWTLWVELRFYALVLLLVAVGVTRRRVLAVCAAWPILALVAEGLGLEPWSTLLLGAHAPFFAGGMVLYLVYRAVATGARPGWAVWPVLVLDVALAARFGTPRVVAMIERNTATDPSDAVVVALAVLSFGAVAALTLTRLRFRGGRVLVTLGALTYPLYLLHEHWGWWVISLARPDLGVVGALVVAVVLVLGLAFAVHHGVERWAAPALRRLVLRLLTPRPRPSRKENPMPMTSKNGRPRPSELPSTVRRSGRKAQRTFAKAHDSAMEQYGDEERAYRVAYAALKHTHEKVGDRWERKEKGRRGPSDARAAAGHEEAGGRPTAGGVDANASVAHLRDVARRLDVPGRSSMSKDELVDAIRRANDRATAQAREGGDG